MNPIERFVRRVDRAQQGFGPAAFVYGVVKKFGDDRAGSLAALVAYYSFLSLFPLLLLLVTVLGIVAGHNEAFAHRVEQSALAQFPVVGSELGKSITALNENSLPGLVIGILGLIWGAMGAIQSAQYAMAEIWNVPGVVRPNFWVRLVRSLLLMAGLGVFLLLSTAATGFAGFASGWPVVAKVGTVAISVLLNTALYLMAFRVLTPKQVGHRGLLPGAVLGGVGWTVLLYLGTLLVNHTLRHASQLYGFFAIVLGLIAWIYLGTQMSLYAAEVNVVKARHLWPRAIVQPPLTEADQRVLAAITLQGARRPEQSVSVRFRPDVTETGTSEVADAAPTEPPTEGQGPSG